MKIQTSLCFYACLLILCASSTISAQETPALKLYHGGNTYWAPDNSTVFDAAPNVEFVMEVTGHPNAPFGLFMSLYTMVYKCLSTCK